MNTSDPPEHAFYEVPNPRAADTTAKLVGRKVALRPLTPDDYGFVYQLATGPDALVRWRHRGSTPPPEQYPQTLWQGVLTQFLAFRAEDGVPIGVVSAYNADFRNQCVSIAVLIAPPFEGRGWAMEAVFLLIDMLFQTWNFRKIYIESLEFNVSSFWSGAGRLFQVEGCLRDHEFHDGRYWHMYLLAIYRDEWIQASAQVLPRTQGQPVVAADSDQAVANRDGR